MTSPPIPDRFAVREELAAGEGEAFFRALDTTLQREVVLKLPEPTLAATPGDADERDRMLREARMLARVRHAGVVQLLDVIETDAGPLLVLEPVAGESLAERLTRAGPLAPDEALDLARSLAKALTAVHAEGVIHRGLSTGNILLRADGSPCLTGFSFAKPGLAAGVSSIDYGAALAGRSGGAVAVPAHPAPEQLLGQPADARSDLFGLGCVLYEAVTGKSPYPRPDPADWEDPAPPQRVVDGVTRPLSDVIVRCLAVSPLRRPDSAAQVSAALEPSAPALPPAIRAKALSIWKPVAAGLLVVAAGLAVLHGTGLLGDASTDPDTRGVALEDPVGVLPPGFDYPAQYDRSLALLIGIGDVYAGNGWRPLPNAERDVDALEQQLLAMGWEGWQIETVTGPQATRTGILAARRRLEERAGENDRVFIYYAGHGVAHAEDRASESGWIIPADGLTEEADPSRASWIRFDEFSRFFDEAQAKHILVAMDCCYSGRLATARSGGAPAYKQRFLRQRAHVVLTSGRRHESVSDGPAGEHSPFAAALLDALRDDDAAALTSSSLYARIGEAFTRQGVGHVPQLAHASDAMGEFVFFLRE